MMAPTMPILTIDHKTEYRYAQPVGFGEHRIMLRPRDGHDLRVLKSRLAIAPEPMSLRWIHDVFGNSVAIATFDERADSCPSTSTVTVEHLPAEDFALTPTTPAYFYPFRYDDEEFPDLAPLHRAAIRRSRWRSCRPGRAISSTRRRRPPTFKILSGMTRRIPEVFTYRKRHEHGTQHPLDTLQTGSGTCRDFALLMIEALRRLGIAARFVSGYLFVPAEQGCGHVGGGMTHAWVQVYLPTAGWIEFDPTNGIVGTRDLIRVAVARDPRQAIPLHGVYLGAADAFIGMDVNIELAESGAQARVEGRAMEIKVGFEIAYTAVQPTPMVIMLSIHPSRYADIIGTETIIAEPERADRLLPRQLRQCLRPAGGARRRRHLARPRAGARFRPARCRSIRPRSRSRSSSCRTMCCSI